MRKTIIVALAPKLLIALWRYTTAGVVIEGAGRFQTEQATRREAHRGAPASIRLEMRHPGNCD